MLQNFLGGIDEEWFRLVHIAIEAAAAPAVARLEPLQQAALQVRNGGTSELAEEEGGGGGGGGGGRRWR